MNVFDKDKTLLLWTPQMGLVVRQDGVLKYISTGVDASQELVDGEYKWRENHLGQPTASKQPRLVGGIAPNSKPAASNQNGEARYFTHPAISFAANQAWSLTVVVNWNNDNNTVTMLCGNGTTDGIYIKSINKKFRLFTTTVNAEFGNVSYVITGKNTVITFVYNSNNILAYVDGNVFGGAVNVNTAITFNNILAFGLLDRYYNGKLSAYHIQSGAMTAAQVLAEHNLLSAMYPEIETVTIDSQVWASRNFDAVATPMGNVITNVTENGAVIKNTNGYFTNGTTGWGLPLPANIKSFTVTNGIATIVANVAAANSLIRNSSGISPTTGKYIKISVRVKSNDGCTVKVDFYESGYKTIIQTNSTEWVEDSMIVKFTNTGFFIQAACISGGLSFDLDYYIVEELNWSNANEIYDAVYAATSGTTAQKEYAALKEAAMWRYPNNDVNKGAWAGKFYNGYAKDLLSLDMATANFGWHIPTNAESEVSITDGNEVKYPGLDFWNDDLGTNETGLTLLGTGLIEPDGTYVGEKELTGFWTTDGDEYPTTGLPIRIVKN